MNVLVVLTGFSGAGKSAVAGELVKKGSNVVDLDAAVEKKVSSKITEIIRVEGEEKFRALETEVLGELISKPPEVISLGGGALVSAKNRDLVLKNSVVVELKSLPKTLAKRIHNDELAAQKKNITTLRPLLIKEGESVPSVFTLVDRVSELYKKREDAYGVANLVIYTDWVIASDIAEVLKSEIDLYKSEEQGKVITIPAKIGVDSQPHQIIIGEGVFSSLPERVKTLFPKATKAVFIVDSQVQMHWEKSIKELSFKGIEFDTIVVEHGEKSKKLATVEHVTDQMLSLGLTRDDVVIGIGGGVVGDITGLVATLFMRGIGLIHVPTTIVAQVDSAIGGKTGVNLTGGKNLLGTFEPAKLVLSELNFLSTLPEREFNAGMAEVIKYGLIDSSKFFSWLEQNVDGINARDVKLLAEVIEYSSNAKLGFVLEDVQDLKGMRAILNFGHTVGHAIERLTEYGEYLHGEAVSVGMIFALKLGESLGFSEVELRLQVQKLLEQFSLPISLPKQLTASVMGEEKFRETWMQALLADKKRASDGLNYVFVKAPGKPEVSKVELSVVVDLLAKE